MDETSTRRKKILLVDDEPLNIKVLSQILKDSYRIMVATSGKEALKCVFSDQPPDLVLLDMVMPQMDGLEVCRRLKESENSRDIPVIFITGKGDERAITRAMQTGAADCMLKPVNPEVLRARVKTVLELRRLMAKTSTGHDLVATALQQEKETNLALRNALRKAQEELEASRQYRHMFLAEMHHEIKTHLTTIVGMTGLSLKHDPPPPLNDYLTTIQNATDTLVSLINDIVDLSLLEEGELEAGIEEFSPWEIVNDVADACSELALKKDVELVIDTDPDIPSLLSGAASRIRQLLTHLIHFNIKWLNTKEILLESTGRFADTGKFLLEFRLSSVDSSLTQREAECLFTYIDPLKATEDQRAAGSGLGLPICRRIVERMDGRISVESSADSGITFICTIPLDCVDKRPVEHQHHRLMKGLNVLVADDNRLAARVISSMLENAGCNVDTVHGWEDVLAIFSGDSPDSGGGCSCSGHDLLVLDWKMPGMECMEIVNRIRKWGSRIPIIVAGMPALLMMSMVHRVASGEDGAQTGDLGFIMKPVKREALFEKVAELLLPERGRENPLEQEDGSTELEGLRVLLVEDNAINRQIARQLLEMKQMKVTGVSSGKAAVDTASKKEFDLILMDIELPDISGIDASRRILAMPGCADMPIIALTAHSWRTHRKAYSEAGMNFCIEKPIDPDQLYQAMRLAIRREGKNE